jgi:LAGLIDADG endonuclease
MITGDWLAGFIDGEGSFNISRHGGNYQPRFSLKLRDDDSEILKEIQKFIGIGTLRKSKCSPIGSKYYSPNAKDQYRLDIIGSDNMKLLCILDEFPLRSKKLRDYNIWKRAVEIYSASLFNRWSDAALKKTRNESLSLLKVELETIRKYHG